MGRTLNNITVLKFVVGNSGVATPGPGGPGPRHQNYIRIYLKLITIIFCVIDTVYLRWPFRSKVKADNGLFRCESVRFFCF